MKTIKTLLFSVSIAVLAISCDSKSENNTETASSKKSDIKVTDVQKANEVIKFNNDFIQLTNDHNRLANSLPNYLQEVNKFVLTPDPVINITPMAPLIVEYRHTQMGDIPDGFGKSKKKMEETFKQYRENYDALKADLNELTKYVKAEDFKDDGAAKLKTLTESLQNKLNIHHQKREEVYAIMNPVADAAEETLLKDHPLKKQILSSKKLLVEVDHLMQQIQDQHEGETFNETALQSSYDKVEKLYNDNSKLKVKGEEYKRQASSFEDFNKEVENFLGATRKLIRDAKTQNAIGDADAIKTSSGYDLVISRYNNFVN